MPSKLHVNPDQKQSNCSKKDAEPDCDDPSSTLQSSATNVMTELVLSTHLEPEQTDRLLRAGLEGAQLPSLRAAASREGMLDAVQCN